MKIFSTRATGISPQVGFAASGIILLLVLATCTTYGALDWAFPEILNSVIIGALALILFAVSGFFWMLSGAGRISLLGVTIFASAIFTILPIVYAGLNNKIELNSFRISIIYFCVTISIMLAGTAFRSLDAVIVFPTAAVGVLRPIPATIAMVVAGGITFGIKYLGLTEAFYSSAIIVLSGISMVFAVKALERKGSKVVAAMWMVVAGFLVLYWLLFLYSGFGRINVASLLLMLLLIVLSVRPSRFLKAMVLIMTPIGLAVGGIVREGGQNISSVLVSGSHMGSAFAPFWSWVKSVEMNADSLIPASTFFKQLLLSLGGWIIPRSMWPDKPAGFGSELAEILSPHLVQVGHSDVSGIFGEHWTYFSGPGIAIGFLVLMLHIALLAKLIRQAARGRYHASIRYVLLFVGVAWAQAQIITLVWTGPFTFWVRVWPVVYVIVLLTLLYKLARGASTSIVIRSRGLGGGVRR